MWEFRDSHLGVPKQNDIWVLALWPGTKYTIRGKVVASPNSRPWWILWIRVCPWFVPTPKCYNYALTNLFFGLCKSVLVSKLLLNLCSPILELQHTPLPLKCYKPKRVPNFFSFTLLTFGLTIQSIKELGGTSIPIYKYMWRK